MNKKRSGNRTFVLVIVLTVILAVAAAGCVLASRYIIQDGSARLEAMKAEVNARNEEKKREYQKELAAFNAENESKHGANLSWPEPKEKGWDVVDLTTYAIEIPEKVTMSRADMLYNGMLLVNQWHSRPEDFDESLTVRLNTRKIRVSSNTVSLLPDAADALSDLFIAAQVQKGYEFYMVEEGFRSFESQQQMFDKEREHLKSRYSNEEELLAATRSRVNLPGTSEYNTGLSLQPRLYKNGDAEVNAKDNNFFESDEGLWLLEHAADYGFIFRFPLADYPVKGTLDKSYKTGVSSRLRLFRYVGRANAAVMTAMNFCLEEYIDFLAEHPHVAVFQDGELQYEIIREYVGSDAEVSVTTSGKSSIQATEMMLDNMGYVITILSY